LSGEVVNEVRPGLYLDSVALMRLSRQLTALPEVADAALMMGTPSNLQVLDDAGLLDDCGRAATPGDLIVAFRVQQAGAANRVLEEARRMLARPATGATHHAARPRGLEAALRRQPESNLALISVPGEFAAAEARKALDLGLHVMVFSDNVSVAEETALKREARERGLLLMGPDCGTAIVAGVPLAFANRVPRGDIGIIGASGTGIQEVSCLIAREGGGVSHALGVGGRDLSAAVGGLSTLAALEILDHDPATRHVLLVAKPGDPGVTAAVLRRIGTSAKTFTACLLGGESGPLPANAAAATTLAAAARHALGRDPAGAAPALPETMRPLPPGRTRVRGLFAGGSLCAEAQVVFLAAGERVTSNVPVPGAASLPGGGDGHQLLDLGADEFTRGRPHPMLDPSVRDAALDAAMSDARVGVVLVDVVIGQGAPPDPAGHLADRLPAHDGATPQVIASVTGTDADAQVRAAQVARLERAGAWVAPSNADAAALALACVRAGATSGVPQ
jgi:FdrA protein